MNHLSRSLNPLAALWAVCVHAASVASESPPKKMAEVALRNQIYMLHTKNAEPFNTHIANLFNLAVAKSFLFSSGNSVYMAMMTMLGGNPQLAGPGANFGLGCQSGRNNGKGNLARRESRYMLNRAAGTFSLKSSDALVNACHNAGMQREAGHLVQRSVVDRAQDGRFAESTSCGAGSGSHRMVV